jgi:prepilin-type N-terminal cleavage/methylation domain-containing protein
MKNQPRVQSRESRACGRRPNGAFGGASYASPHFIPGLLSGTRVTRPSGRSAFTLVEMLVTLALLSLIVLALMAVFNSTQKAFRASLTQTDILESGRLAMGLLVGDLETMTPSSGLGNSNGLPSLFSPVNFYANTNFNCRPLIQSLTASSAQRTNVLENFFILSRRNIKGTPNWVGTGYTVVTNSPHGLYSLYRFSTNFPAMTLSPWRLFYTDFNSFLLAPTNYSHLMDGVVDLTVRPYDPNGLEMTNSYEADYNGSTNTFINQNTSFMKPGLRVVGFYMYSNTVPASVEVEMGVLEDAVLQRAEGLGGAAQMNYLSNHVGQLHLFRQRVWIRNVDPTAYQ